jgi:hypothetical protein
VATLAASVSSCVGQNETETFTCMSASVFTGEYPQGGAPAGASVSEYMARRCGTLDCHGSVARPLRLYGQYGLREPTEDNVSGVGKTTPLELSDNYEAVCGLQPEQMTAAVADHGASADQLVLIEKARGEEAHKGGQVTHQGGQGTLPSPGDDCIAGWLRGDPPAMVAAACQAAIDGL